MKYSTALKRSKGSVRFLVVAVPCVWGIYLWIRFWPIAAAAAFMSLYLVMDVRNIVKIQKALESDPDFLKKKLPGT